jgi:hypothetical protein
MNAVTMTAADRTVRFTPKLFAAFRLDPQLPGRVFRIAPFSAADLDEALNDAKTRCSHKETLVIRETDQLSGETRLHLYAVKQKSRPTYVWEGHRQVAVRDLYLEPVCTLPAEVLS